MPATHAPTRRLIGSLAGATAAATVLVLGGPAAQAAPACTDPVAGALHAGHDRTGDPAGVFHTAEDTYCDVRG
ncbi:hypothetical protein BKA08_000105 [Nocardioides marinisabuli]|uniref:Uncharacterized protein n=1 Tax=Nocardioides marinisabuli TaxID=419476 RepID=A0A7Y9JNG7_9ACTN|nr:MULTISPECIES: hypothetical protein [Nocardioides]NYD55867.1 hypothetical protein [Nocardioides marinisabuli]